MARSSSGWKHYQKRTKKYVPIRLGEKFHRLMVIEIRPQKKGSGSPAKVVCRCECSHLVETNAASLRKGYVRACAADTVLEKRLAKQIAAAREVERLTSPHVPAEELPKRESWQWAGKEERTDIRRAGKRCDWIIAAGNAGNRKDLSQVVGHHLIPRKPRRSENNL